MLEFGRLDWTLNCSRLEDWRCIVRDSGDSQCSPIGGWVLAVRRHMMTL